MELKWVEDTRYWDCWDLMRTGEIITYIMRPRVGGTLVWFRRSTSQHIKAPSQDVEEAKAIIQAMVLLEG